MGCLRYDSGVACIHKYNTHCDKSCKLSRGDTDPKNIIGLAQDQNPEV